MHHFLFPISDTYITNRPNNLDTQNFGATEILQLGTQNQLISYISPTTDYLYSNVVFDSVGVQYFNGTFTGSILGTTGSSYAYLVGSGSIISSSYFSGSYLGGAINGIFSGSFEVDSYIGSITSGSYVCFYGTASGTDTRQQPSRQYSTQSFADHALLQFDITAISQSIASGDIVSASFFLKVKICNEFELPMDYSVYVAPLSESWIGGVGYKSDGGDTNGASWVYRDFDGGTAWATPGGTVIPIYSTQSFHHKSADLDMDITSIVNQWMAGLPNNGLIIQSSDEFFPTGSGFILKYFSNETNTVYSPVLDAGWDDSSFVTGSFYTASAQVSAVTASSMTVNGSGSWINAVGGVHGNFTASTALTIGTNYITASGDMTPFCNELVQQFTGSLTGSFYGIADVIYGTFSGSGTFYTDYYSGSVNGILLESSGNISGIIDAFLSGTVIMPTGSTTLFTGYLYSNAISLTGTGSGQYYDSASLAFNGFIFGTGISGNITGDSVFGPAFGVISVTSTVVTLPTEWKYSYPTSPNEAPYGDIIRQIFNCPECGDGGWVNRANPWNSSPPPNSQFCSPTPYAFDSLYYVWSGDDVGWTMNLPQASSSVITSSCGKYHTVQLMTGTFSDGVFSGSSFFAFYENYKISFALLTGSWNPSALNGETLVVTLPPLFFPYYTAILEGPYIYGPIMGIYTTSGSYSASFYGQFTDGMFLGATADLQLTGSAVTSSYSYTSSVNLSSSYLLPLDVEQQFSINLTNLQSEYKSGDIIKLSVFGRKKYPQKFFDHTNQQMQYLIPEFLPSSSYYALKDNQTDEIVVNFDSYTRISCDYPYGNYFLVDTTGLPQERYYRVLIRVTDGSITDTIDTGKIFKITR